jgi:hypothetical protein
METRRYLVTTSQVRITTWATSRAAAIAIVMAAEIDMPRSAIISVEEVKQ